MVCHCTFTVIENIMKSRKRANLPGESDCIYTGLLNYMSVDAVDVALLW